MALEVGYFTYITTHVIFNNNNFKKLLPETNLPQLILPWELKVPIGEGKALGGK